MMTSIRRNFTTVLCTGFLLSTLFVNGQTPTLADTMTRLYQDAWEYAQRPSPFDVDQAPGGLTDMSQSAIEARASYWKGVQYRLDSVKFETLSKDDRINFDVFRYIVDDFVAEYDLRTYLMPFDAEGGFHTAFGFLPGSSPFNTQEDYKHYLSKLKDFSTQVDAYIDLLEEGIADGRTMPQVIMQDFENTALAYITDSIEASIFFDPFIRIPENATWRQPIYDMGYLAVATSVAPAYRKLANYLHDTYIPACRKSIAATDLPGGAAYYQQRLNYFTTLDLSAEEIFDIGQTEVTRIRGEMELIIDSLHFDGSFQDFLTFLRTDPRFYARTPHELLAEASYFSKRIDGKLPQYFGKLPRMSYGVAPVPDQIAPRYTGGRYVEGSYKDSKAGTYWVNTHKLESRPLYVLPALTLHEAVPGHHLQIMLAAETEFESTRQLPDFRGDYYISAFGEGWALYAEWLGKEMGIYENLYQQFGALTYEMWRACRLVVDPGMHALGWTRDQAVGFMAENTALSLHEINTEINRYIGWPAQAVSYKIGELKIRELRKAAEVALGERFDLRAFHDKVLENGSIPLSVLERVMHGWIKERKQDRN